MNGSLVLALNKGYYFRVFGGAYGLKPTGVIGVKMAAEIPAACVIDIPIQDFSIPSESMAQQGLRETIDAITAGKPVYVGCMAGRGRTGLMLALIAKAWGIKNPVEYVRANYYSHAVETDRQYAFVMNFRVPQDVITEVFWLKFWSWFRFGGPKALTYDEVRLMGLIPRPRDESEMSTWFEHS